jgi:ABC-type transport system substrate-binding protein
MQVSGAVVSEESLQSGPYVDKIVYKVISNQDQRVLEMQAGTIDMDNSFFDPMHYATLDADPNIAIYRETRNGYGQITINCRDYPLNISGLRRAFAYAFDKTRVTAEVMDGFSIEHDSLVPLPNSFCIEDEFDWNYYTDKSDIGNQLLDNLGFEINETTGFRHAPNGAPFDIQIWYSSSFEEILGGVAQIGVDALQALHIDAEKTVFPWEYPNPISSHGNYDMYVSAINFYSNDVDWLAYEYWSDYADVQDQNPANFRNATYDACREQLLHGTTYEAVHNASSWMQRILHEQVPRLVVYENTYLQAYRTDKFTGFVEDLGRYITGPWTMRKIHELDGTTGGTLSVAIAEEPDSFNIYDTNSAYSEAILENLWPSLYSYGPDLNPYPDLAESMLTETHADNPAVPLGHTRFTIDMIQNATWSDGEPLTAEDVAFTFIYILESAAYDNPAIDELEDLVAAYAPSTYRAVLEFSTESYWHFSHFAYTPIIPRHIFNDEEGIGYAGWDSWNPIFDPSEPNVDCGPFTFSTYESGESYEIVKNPLFHYRVQETSTTTTTNSSVLVDNSMLAVILTISAASAVVILGTSYFVYLERERKRSKIAGIPW